MFQMYEVKLLYDLPLCSFKNLEKATYLHDISCCQVVIFCVLLCAEKRGTISVGAGERVYVFTQIGCGRGTAAVFDISVIEISCTF